MQITNDLKSRVFGKTAGLCFYCNKQLAYGNHGDRWTRGAWHIDHKISQMNGGTDEFSNLIAACIDCNEDKSALNAASYRRLTRPIRVTRRKDRVVSDLEAVAAVISILAIIGGIDVFAWWKKRAEAKKISGPEADVAVGLPWLGISCFLVIFIVFVVIIKANKIT